MEMQFSKFILINQRFKSLFEAEIGLIKAKCSVESNLQLFNLYINHLSLRVIFCFLIILQLPQNLLELLVPSCMIVLLRILEGLVLGLSLTVSTSSLTAPSRLKFSGP